MLRFVVATLLVGAAHAQMFGMGSKRDPLAGMSQEERDHMEGTPHGAAAVDRAMQEWDTLSSNPEKMQEILASFKDPEVMEKAKEMINDPEYMKAAKKKLQAMQAKARDAGLLDANGQPVPGAATAAGKSMPAAMAMMQQMIQNGAMGQGGGMPQGMGGMPQ